MNTQKLLNIALDGIDTLGFQLDQMGITGKVNRHNIAAFLMAEQKHLEGEWDSIQARVDRRRSQFDYISGLIGSRTDAVLSPIFQQVNRLRARS
ncbi:MAG TPA: hypothetical protein VL091_08095 [Marinobacter sp.]|nr:hypothetical protein [Marinobacter sp.]